MFPVNFKRNEIIKGSDGLQMLQLTLDHVYMYILTVGN